MNFLISYNRTLTSFSLFLSLCLLLLTVSIVTAQPQPVTVIISDKDNTADLADRFLGLSYEMSMLLPKDGRYYFDPNDRALIQTFKTLGIKSLRVGANAVDDPRIAVPQEKDIDVFFNFARAAGVKVIYSFRLKDGDPADSAQLASYIAKHDADVLDCFSIGNEPNFFIPTYEAFFAQWKPHYDAILKSVPDAIFDGPSSAGKDIFTLNLAKAICGDGHLAMASDHYYFLGSGRESEKNPPATRDRFLSNNLHKTYEKAYSHVGAILAAERIPYRIDELNSCYNGGAKDASDTYASTLWALDCTHWWATHHILGMNYHTGESVGRDGGFAAANYAAFVHEPNGQGFEIRPQAYAYLAFSQGAHGKSLETKTITDSAFNFNVYAYRDHDNSVYITLINKSYGANGQVASVSLQLPPSLNQSEYQRMDLVQKDNDIAAKSGVSLGSSSIDSQGIWTGQWETIKNSDGTKLSIQLAPTSATILHVSASR